LAKSQTSKNSASNPTISFPSHSHTFVYLEEECTYHSTLVNLVLIMLFSEMLNFSKNIFLKEQNFVKESIESSKNLKISNLINFQQTCVEVAKVIQFLIYLPSACNLSHSFCHTFDPLREQPPCLYHGKNPKFHLNFI
jgi:hypothetical protein